MKAVVLLSGGMDSAALLLYLLDDGYEVRALGFNYGQRHSKELGFAKALAEDCKVPFSVAEMGNLRELLPGSSQTDESVAVPEGKYDEDSMKATVVPNRNMIMLAIAIGHAIAHDCDAVAYAAHAGDHAIYPDCRPEFAESMARAAGLCDWKKIQLMRPFITISKASIAALGNNLGLDFQKTWSCYKGGDVHCGRCGTCIERREALHLAGVPDPTIYAVDAPSLKTMIENDWHLPK